MENGTFEVMFRLCANPLADDATFKTDVHWPQNE